MNKHTQKKNLSDAIGRHSGAWYKKQEELANELEVNQSVISRFLNSDNEYILVRHCKKLIDCYRSDFEGNPVARVGKFK